MHKGETPSHRMRDPTRNVTLTAPVPRWLAGDVSTYLTGSCLRQGDGTPQFVTLTKSGPREVSENPGCVHTILTGSCLSAG